MSLRNSPMFCGRKCMAPMVWGFGGIWASNLMINALPFEIWTIKTRCFLHHVFNTDCGEKRYSWYLFVVLIFKMIPVDWKWHFNFWLMMNGWSLEILFFFCDKKCLTSGGFNPEPLDSCQMLCHLKWILTYPCTRQNKVCPEHKLSQRTGLVIL